MILPSFRFPKNISQPILRRNLRMSRGTLQHPMSTVCSSGPVPTDIRPKRGIIPGYCILRTGSFLRCIRAARFLIGILPDIHLNASIICFKHPLAGRHRNSAPVQRSIRTGFAGESLYISQSASHSPKTEITFHEISPDAAGLLRRQHVHLTGRNRVSGAVGSSAVPLRNPAVPVPSRFAKL